MDFLLQPADGSVEFIQRRLAVRMVLLEQRFALLTGVAQLRDPAIARRAMQAVHALDQSLAVTCQSRLADRAAIAFQRLQQHAEHVVCEVCLARGQAQAS